MDHQFNETISQRMKILEDKIKQLTTTLEDLKDEMKHRPTLSKVYHSSGKFTGAISFKTAPHIDSDEIITVNNCGKYIASGIPFTLQANTAVLQDQSPTVGPDSIFSGNSSSNVKILEQYYPAFVSFKVGFSDVSNVSVGFVFTDAVNTFMFSFQISTDVFFTENGTTSGDKIPYSDGDVFTLILNDSYCYYYQNGILVRQTENLQDITKSYNVQFYIGDPGKHITQIRYGI